MVALTRRGRRVVTGVVAAVVLATTVVGVTALLRGFGGSVVVSERCTATVDGRSFQLAPDQAGNAATITAVAVRRGLPARAATIAIATSIQESKLRNLDYGDRDSLGLFQQRPSQGWGTPEQVQDPIYAANAFYDALVRIDGYQSMEITVASDRVQRSAFPDAVADHEPDGRAFASALTGHSPGALTCRLRPVAHGQRADASAVREQLARELGDLPVAGEDPSSVVVELGSGPTEQRLAWAVAHWAVAHADDLDVVTVSVAGRTWFRAGDGGWEDAASGSQGADASAEPGHVVITLPQP